MKKVDQLTIIACSGSILAATLFSNSGGSISAEGASTAQRSTAINEIDLAEVSQLVQQSTPVMDLASASSYETRKQQAAFGRFGCGCEGCANASIGGIEGGQVVQPQQFISTAAVAIHRAPRL